MRLLKMQKTNLATTICKKAPHIAQGGKAFFFLTNIDLNLVSFLVEYHVAKMD